MILVSAAGLAGLGACDRPEPPPRVANVSPAMPEPGEELPRFIGRWAATPRLCADGAWVFRADGVSTAGEVSCQFRAVEPSAAGYRIQAACIHEGEESESQIGLAMTDPAPPQSMTVEGGPWDGPITLRRCEVQPEG